MIQLTVTDTLQDFTNDYIFETQDDMIVAIQMLFDFTKYSKESLHDGVFRFQARSDTPLDTNKPYYYFKKEQIPLS